MLGEQPAICTGSLAGLAFAPAACWETFPSGDPNIKLALDAVRGRHVIFLISSDSALLFDQLAVLLFLQRFHEPHALPEYAKDKWKRSLADGKYDIASAGSISVVIPWYRHCQMERTCRWEIADGKWTNSVADGAFVDVPTCLQYAALLSAPPILAGPRGGARGAPPLPPPPSKQLLLLDIHEYEDLELSLNGSAAWANAQVEYDTVRGAGTYFASAFDHFLSHVLLPSLGKNVAAGLVVFPDFGAHRRFQRMVKRACGMQDHQILWIPKSRVGTEITQVDGLMYLDATGAEVRRTDSIPASCHVLLADDFTNSGTTLFGGAAIIRVHAEPGVYVAAYVTHFVGKYSRETVSSFVKALYEGGETPSLDAFHCTDSVAQTIGWLREELTARDATGAPRRAHIMGLAPVIASWVKSRATPPDATTPGATPAAAGATSSCGVC